MYISKKVTLKNGLTELMANRATLNLIIGKLIHAVMVAPILFTSVIIVSSRHREGMAGAGGGKGA